ncbi:hypothetical protein SAMN02744775_02231 [Enterobacter sp. CC120223-11]|nr:hypothetical protein SAMN02744775_02231 [Enterobacter sp. CC120223-11]
MWSSAVLCGSDLCGSVGKGTGQINENANNNYLLLRLNGKVQREM